MEVIVPDGACGDWRIESFVVTEQESEKSKLMATIRCDYADYIAPGKGDF